MARVVLVFGRGPFVVVAEYTVDNLDYAKLSQDQRVDLVETVG